MSYLEISVKFQINANAESHVKRRMRWKESATILECAPKTLKSQTARIGGLVKFLTISMKIYCHQYQICSVTIYLSFHYQYQRILDKCECGKPCKVSGKGEEKGYERRNDYGYGGYGHGYGDESEGICNEYGKCTQDIDKPDCTDWEPGKN